MSNCAFDKGEKCKALTKKDCKNCSFYKTREELIEGRQKAEKRIKNLSPTLKSIIKRKYYSRGKLED